MILQSPVLVDGPSSRVSDHGLSPGGWRRGKLIVGGVVGPGANVPEGPEGESEECDELRVRLWKVFCYGNAFPVAALVDSS